MKPLVLALTVVLFATLLNMVVGAGTIAGSQVVASYKEYDRRQFLQRSTIACVRAKSWEDMDEAEKLLLSIAGGNNKKKTTVPLGKGAIMIKFYLSQTIRYCKFVPRVFKGIRHLSMNRQQSVEINTVPRYAFYAKKAADKSPKAIQETAAKVEALVLAEKEKIKKRFMRGSIIVEITAANVVYVGPIAQ